jgi:hypothetical protein
MVAYGTDQAACQLLIESQQPLVHRQQARKHMPPELVDDIIDEIVPPAVKGRDMDSLLQQAGCGRSDVYSYENVTISRSSDCCFPLKPERDESVTIRFKRQACFQAKFAVSKENKGIAGAR